MTTALRFLAALAAGLLFGLGLAISGMLNPAKVQAFLDVAGAWDPSLVFVLGSGVLVAFLGYRLAFALDKPLLESRLHLPAKTQIDRSLVVGSALFGVGWGLVGFCPGPAVASLSLGLTPAVVFVVAMLVGMVVHDRFAATRG
ncbi:YeeE/YedE family protein [Bosea sp. AS-1]|uniref:YeeE/YedE family protein n=1 Tax=Bosea sp. AS-1 TaxID=2015316 RepID=UPI000B77D92C|nr:YeeE/YedE family protein [Bosea sp. AS-1]